MLSDKEVGELWYKWRLYSHDTEYGKHDVLSLIRKLVEERAQLYHFKEPAKSYEWGNALHWALRDFHIDPATWNP